MNYTKILFYSALLTNLQASPQESTIDTNIKKLAELVVSTYQTYGKTENLNPNKDNKNFFQWTLPSILPLTCFLYWGVFPKPMKNQNEECPNYKDLEESKKTEKAEKIKEEQKVQIDRALLLQSTELLAQLIAQSIHPTFIVYAKLAPRCWIPHCKDDIEVFTSAASETAEIFEAQLKKNFNEIQKSYADAFEEDKSYEWHKKRLNKYIYAKPGTSVILNQIKNKKLPDLIIPETLNPIFQQIFKTPMQGLLYSENNIEFSNVDSSNKKINELRMQLLLQNIRPELLVQYIFVKEKDEELPTNEYREITMANYHETIPYNLKKMEELMEKTCKTRDPDNLYLYKGDDLNKYMSDVPTPSKRNSNKTKYIILFVAFATLAYYLYRQNH